MAGLGTWSILAQGSLADIGLADLAACMGFIAYKTMNTQYGVSKRKGKRTYDVL